MRTKTWVVLAGLVLLTMPAAGQVTLRYQWRAGDAYLLDKVVDLTGTIRSGTAPPVETSQSAKIRKKVTVDEVDSGGWAHLSVALLSVSATKSIGEQQLQYSMSPDQVVLGETLIWRKTDREGLESSHVRSLQQLFVPSALKCSARGQSEDPLQPLQKVYCTASGPVARTTLGSR